MSVISTVFEHSEAEWLHQLKVYDDDFFLVLIKYLKLLSGTNSAPTYLIVYIPKLIILLNTLHIQN